MIRAVRRRLATGDPCEYYFRQAECDFAYGVLTLTGSVPTERLKQRLTDLLADLDELVAVDNQVDVISSDGLSSVHPN